MSMTWCGVEMEPRRMRRHWAPSVDMESRSEDGSWSWKNGGW